MGVQYQVTRPSRALSPYVKYFWTGEVPVSRGVPFTHIAVATVSPKLVFHYGGQFSAASSNSRLQPPVQAGIQGPFSTPARFTTTETVGIFGIEFFPYALPSLFSVPSSALANQYVDLHTFLGTAGRELEERVLTARNNHERLHLAVHFLESLAKKPVRPEVAAAMQLIDGRGGNIDAPTLLKNIPLSERQLERLFKTYTGFSPKQYARIVRFENTLGKLRSDASFTATALDAGYFDQAHFNHDFMAFTGLHPNGYLRAIAHLPLRGC